MWKKKREKTWIRKDFLKVWNVEEEKRRDKNGYKKVWNVEEKEKRQGSFQPSPSWCLSFLISLTYLIFIQATKKCRSVEQLTDSAVYISAIF